MNKTKSEVNRMTDKQTQQFIEALKIITEKSETKDEILEALNRIQEKGKKNPQ